MGVNSDIKAMHGTLEQFEDAIDKRINTDVMLRIENLEKDNQKALGDLQSQIGDSISQRMKPSEDKLREVDGEISGLHKTVAIFESRHVETTNSLKEVTVVTERIQTQVNDQGQKMAEQSANDLNRINDRLQDIENQSGLADQKIKELDAGNQNLLEKVLGVDGNLSDRLDKQEQMDNTLMNRINELHSSNSESVSSIQLRLGDMDKESKDNITQIVNLQEIINIQAERVNAVDADRQKVAASNAEAIADLKNELGQSIVDKFRPAEDRLANIDGDIQGLNKTVAVFEQKHTETAEKIQEVTVLTSNIQVQVKAQEQKMVEQSANDMNQIKEQLKDVENQAGLSGQKIKELDAGHQTLVEKISGMENGVADRLDDLAKADASLLAKLSALESTNEQTVRAATADLEKKIHDAEHKLDQSSKAEIQSVGQHLEEQMRTNNSNTERRLAEADAGSQQLLEKLLEVEKDVEGKVRDNASSVQNQLINLDAENKNNAQMLVTLQESVNIQVQESKKVDAERQRSEAKAKEDLDANAAANARAIADLKDQLGETIAQRVKPTEDRLSEVNGDIKAMHGTLEQFEDAIDKRINTDVMLRIENLEKDNQKALGDLQSQIGDSISQRMKPSEDKLREVDGEISGLHKTVAIFESRHVETTNSL